MSAGRTLSSERADPCPTTPTAGRRAPAQSTRQIALAVALARHLSRRRRCSAEIIVGDNAITQADLDQKVAQQRANRRNQPELDIDGPDALKAELGASTECVLSVEGEPDRYAVTVTVKEVNEDTKKAHLDIEVAKEPLKK
jgi:hypothetical protein